MTFACFVVDNGGEMLNERQIRFAQGVASGKTLASAYKDAGYDPENADANASRQMGIDGMAAEVEKWRMIKANISGINTDWVLDRWKLISEADPNEITRVIRGCCQHCWGEGFAFQWKQSEFDREMRAALASMTTKAPRSLPDARGGFGFRMKREPNPECPECEGEGVERTFLADTTKLSEAGKQLFAGVKETKNGIEIKLHSKPEAMAAIADYLGMKKSTLELSGPGGGPIPMSAKDLTDDELATRLVAIRAERDTITP